MQPAPSSPSTSSKSGSIQRFKNEYDGWWIRSGVPSLRRIAAASRVFHRSFVQRLRTIRAASSSMSMASSGRA